MMDKIFGGYADLLKAEGYEELVFDDMRLVQEIAFSPYWKRYDAFMKNREEGDRDFQEEEPARVNDPVDPVLRKRKRRAPEPALWKEFAEMEQRVKREAVAQWGDNPVPINPEEE
jgi:hypothetical protein